MVLELNVNWTGGRIGLGSTVLHFINDDAGVPNADAIAARVMSFFSDRASTFPNEVSLINGPELTEYTNSGVLTAVYPVSVNTPTVGLSAANFANGMGTLTRLETGEVVAGRRLQGRIYLVPRADVFDIDGDVKQSTIGADATAFDDMLADLDALNAPLCVWSRKNASVARVTNARTLSRPQSLRTRNDRV